MKNPIYKAAFAAYGELTSADAIAWYRDKINHSYLILATVTTLTAGFINDWLLEPTDEPVVQTDQLCLPYTPIAGLLTAGRDRILLTPGILPTGDTVIVPPSTPAPARAAKGGVSRKIANASDTKMITAKKLKQALAVIKPCLSRDASKHVLNQVAIITNQDGTWFGATDGHRCCLIKVAAYNGHDSTTPVDFAQLAEHKAEGIDLEFTKGSVTKINQTVVNVFQYGQYPSLFAIIPREKTSSKLCVTQLMASELIDTLKALPKGELYHDLTNSFQSGASWTGKPGDINARFYRKYLLEAAKACKLVGQTNWKLEKNVACVASAEGFCYLVMPVRVR